MKKSDHISPQEVQGIQQAGKSLVLVCAYDDDANHQRIAIDGSISFPTFQQKLATMANDQPIVFFCDCPHDELAEEKTATFRSRGYSNTMVLAGGIQAWQKAVA